MAKDPNTGDLLITRRGGNKTDWLHDEDSQHSSVKKLWQRDSPLPSYQRQTSFKTAIILR
ncbi:hypothetical protein H112_05801 [Trichophyton rubrum D6]|uniref:Uncharacterized protein n=2 Tax=Trichophyton TaxID=5550 RepID=A0A022VZ60_TRIRU|nr:hypothetical protein H100_05818 [Trichophyton rubrum MR850]EZF40235.1 hypothetical protein H102_05787 [Trichophyton rubrum CBS 100081]EZF51008.1 hypothetical protein H103_05813 [Trichophyton rubrum CBS 288.86]EZF61432.1 hypothetical protein H104_05798 [Trichophyton rubrum CBS 289.86]EZF72113.1 hypothetical protein H105_05827 [Trichophyton soudanense CBS 452.61]EZF82755.1 hypothetical protein H110_05806 [Trichophyton rubrum MR1448]EZF93696.1 hypothetical protein H113_05855 [Trichophyton rub